MYRKDMMMRRLFPRKEAEIDGACGGNGRRRRRS